MGVKFQNTTTTPKIASILKMANCSVRYSEIYVSEGEGAIDTYMGVLLT